MTELSLITPSSVETPEKKPWERMEGESSFWYNRYKRFQGLGPKRTMLAALEQERCSSKAPKSTQKQEKPKPALVPGSWKAASIRWHWIERAQAYDEDKVEQMVQIMFEDLYSGPGMAFHRVTMLRNLSTTIQKDFNLNNTRMTPDQKIAYYARLTAILRDIREEMKIFDAPTQRLLLRHFAYKEYQDFKSSTTPEGFLQLAERAGGMENVDKLIEAEMARRKEQEHNRKAFAKVAALD
jgi:hypothetical protein